MSAVQQVTSLVRPEPSARAVVDEVRAGHRTPLDLVEDAIARIEEIDPLVNAMVTRTFDRALAQARSLMEDKARGGAYPALCGLPLAVKDNSDLAGVATSGGSPITAGRVPEQSDPVIAQLERHGAIAMGKSNLSELGGANTTNSIFGATLNPYDLSLTCGGSSGGTAVALATGQVFLGHGNDVGGSLRTPAAFCGIAGLRPSPGLVARKAMADPFDTVFVEGPMARNSGDVALMLDAMVGRHSKDLLSRERGADSYAAMAGRMDLPASIAFSPDCGVLPVAGAVRQDFRKVVEVLAGSGARVSEAAPDFSGVQQTIDTLRGLSYATTWQAHWPNDRARFTPEVRGDIARGVSLTGPVIAKAMGNRAMFHRRALAFFENHDVLVTPVTQVRPFRVDLPWPRSIDGHPLDNYTSWIGITYIWSIIGFPALAVTVGHGADGLPIALQLIGPPYSEGRLLSFGSWLESEIRLIG